MKPILIVNIVLWFISHLPVICLSDDANFGTLTNRSFTTWKFWKWKLRISAICIFLGNKSFYIITYNISENRFDWGKVLALDKIKNHYITNDELIEKERKYREEHLPELQEQEVEIEKEKLLYHLQIEQERFDKSIDKINTYTTILLTSIPIVVAINYITDFIETNFIFKALIIYVFLNLALLIFGTMKVQGMMRSSFRDLKEDNDKNKKIVSSYYYDWQSLKRKSDLMVSIVVSVQEWLIVLVFLFGLIIIGGQITSTRSNTEHFHQQEVLNITIDEIDIAYSGSSINFLKLMLAIEENNCRHIIILFNEKDNIGGIVDELSKYDNLTISIIKDSLMERGHIKIVEVK